MPLGPYLSATRRTSPTMRQLLTAFTLPLTLAATLSGCGWYTNVPAQITVVEVKPGRVTYGPVVDNVHSTAVEDPTVTLRAEPGSIGSTFNSIDITFYKDLGATSDGTTLKSIPVGNRLPAMHVGLSFHVDSSNFPSDPLNVNPIEQADVGQKVYVGRYTFSPPVMTRLVEEYGMLPSNDTDTNQPGVFADCVLHGADDANFPAEVEFWVPITFSGNGS